MRGTIARASGWDGENWQVRTEILPERVCIDQSGTNLAELFWYWQERSMLDGDVPFIGNFRFPGSDLPWVEIAAEDPMNFVIRNHPSGATGNWSDIRLAEHPVSMHGQSCAFEYQDCKMRRTPTFVRIEQHILGVDRDYVKLTVPVADKNGDVVQVFYGVQLLKYSVIRGGLS